MSEQTRKDLEKALVAHLKDINDDSPILGGLDHRVHVQCWPTRRLTTASATAPAMR